MTAPVDLRFKEHATAAQARYIDAVNEHGSQRAAARALGVQQSCISAALASAERRAMRKLGFAPADLPGFDTVEATTRYDASGILIGQSRRQRPNPDLNDAPLPIEDGFAISKITELYDRSNDKTLRWVQKKPQPAVQYAAMQAAFAALAEPLQGLSPLISTPVGTDDSLLTVYPLGDPHFGMHSWAAETGTNFDLKEAERLTCAAADKLVSLAPASTEATLLNLGDYFHADDQTNRTPGHGNQLDVDGRYQKVITVGVKAMRWCALRLLQKHQHVRIRNVRGNHDPHAHVALAIALEAYFENEPRITVDMSPAPYTFQRFGQVLIGEGHGDGAKATDLPGVMMNDAREHISATKFWYWHNGHVHHDSLKEYQNVLVEYHRTLAAKDFWHWHKGYRSGRTMKSITYHKDFGEFHRSTCDAAMFDV